MADDMTGVEKLRKLSDDAKLTPLWECLRIERRRDWSASSILDPIRLKDALSEIADQIEREHVEAINAKIETICTFAREVDRLKEGAGRDLTGEAREAVERLRAIPHEDVLRSANPDFIIVNELCRAVGVDRRPTYTGTLDAVCDRLVELIEHGGGQGADVAALRKLADEMNEMIDYNRMMWEVTGDKSHHGACCALSSYPQRIRDAVDGAPEPDAEREAAADWVAEQGGLDEIKHHYAFMTEQVAKHVGIERGADEPEHVTIGRILGELGKRLMPLGMEWPRFEDGERVGIGDAYASRGHEQFPTIQCIAFNAAGFYFNGSKPKSKRYGYGDRVKRPEPEVLGADGLPIKVGDTVYDNVLGLGFKVASYDDTYLTSINGGILRIDAATKNPPDTQERIDDDATLDPATYCDDVLGWDAEKIVHHSDYAAQNEAMIADLLRRQRELDAKTMGGER